MTVEVRIDEGLWEGAMCQEAILLGWAAAPGSRVEQGQKIAELLVEGARHEITAPVGGRLNEPVAVESVLEPGDLICRIVEN